MRTSYALACLIGLSGSSGWAATEDVEGTVLVLELGTEGVDDPKMGAAVAAQIAEKLASRGRSVATMADVQQQLQLESQKELLGCQSNSACIARLTDENAADLVVAGTIGRIGAKFLLNLSLIDPKAADPKGRAGITFDGAEKLPVALDQVLGELFGWTDEGARPMFKLPEGQKSSFLVLDVTAAGVPEETAKNLTQVLSKEIKGIEGAEVVNRDDVVAMLGYEKMKNILTDCDTSCLVEIGNALDTNYVVLGQVGKPADTYLVSLTLIDQSSLDVGNSYRVSETYRGSEDQLIAAVAFAGRRLLGVEARFPGGVQVASPVQEAEVHLGAKKLGEVPMPPVRDLSPGRYSLRLSKAGFYDWQSDVYISPGETTAVWAELVAEPQPWYEKWWVWTLVGAAVAGGVTAGIVASQATPDNGSVTIIAEPAP